MALSPPAPSRRLILRGLGAWGAGLATGAGAATLPLSVLAQPRFPTRPVTLIVPWPAGGATDLQMRVLAEGAARHLGQPVIVENRPGAGGTLAMPLIQQAAPDGHVIAQLPLPALRAPWVQKLLWDPIRDTTPLLRVSGVTFGVVVAANSPFRSLNEVLAWARRHPDALTVGTNGIGTTPHVVMDELMERAGGPWVHVPYKGTAEQMLAVASGQIMVGVNSSGFTPFVESGKLRLLAIFSAQRSKRFPDVPTLRELGHDLVANSPYGLVGPRGLPPHVVAVLHEAFRQAMQEPAHLAELAKADQELAYQGPEDYGRYLREAYEGERRIVERLGLARHAQAPGPQSTQPASAAGPSPTRSGSGTR